MSEQTFTAKRLSTALSRIKRELGPDAVILSSRRIDDGSGEARFEVRAASSSRQPVVVHEKQGARGTLLMRLLRKNGVGSELARALTAHTEGEPRTLREATEALSTSLSRHLGFSAPSLATGRHVVALVGPTGVGKTTTLAKLAAEAALVNKRRVAIITLDTFRIGATAQIEQFAELIGVPLLSARDAESFARCLRRLADAEVIFVDTAGRSPRDKSAFVELAKTLQMTHSVHPETQQGLFPSMKDEPYRLEVSLCVSATSRPSELEAIAERHAVLRPTSLTITKVDEVSRHDAIALAQIASGLPLAWFTTGQCVPEDIEVARPDRLAAALCGEEVYA